MKTAREQREANTVKTSAEKMSPEKMSAVHANKAQANLQPEVERTHAQRAAALIERAYLWSRPSCAIMSLRLGISYDFGTGQVPV